jgi:hypothetical protein
VLEYVTQLVFTAAVALLLPLPFAIVLATLQTLVFAATLRYGGLDLNHKPIAMLDAYCPGSFTPLAPPTYHALHHVYPDAYYSAYTKLIDILVAGGAQLRGRRAVIQRAQSPLGRALGEVLREQGVTVIESDDALDESVFRETDVLLLCDPETDEIPILESFIDATQARQLPPEAWVVHSRSENPTARHYVDDIRINYRTLVVPDADGLSASRADEAARRAVSQIRRGFHYVSSTAFSERLWGHLRFHATQPIPPQQARLVRHRSELLTTS